MYNCFLLSFHLVNLVKRAKMMVDLVGLLQIAVHVRVFHVTFLLLIHISELFKIFFWLTSCNISGAVM